MHAYVQTCTEWCVASYLYAKNSEGLTERDHTMHLPRFCRNVGLSSGFLCLLRKDLRARFLTSPLRSSVSLSAIIPLLQSLVSRGVIRTEQQQIAEKKLPPSKSLIVHPSANELRAWSSPAREKDHAALRRDKIIAASDVERQKDIVLSESHENILSNKVIALQDHVRRLEEENLRLRMDGDWGTLGGRPGEFVLDVQAGSTESVQHRHGGSEPGGLLLSPVLSPLHVSTRVASERFSLICAYARKSVRLYVVVSMCERVLVRVLSCDCVEGSLLQRQHRKGKLD